MKFQSYPDREMMMIDLANILAGELGEAVRSVGRASIAVPGGSTPGPIFDALCAADLDWSKVTILPTDERWVPETSEHSNAKLIKERLLIERAGSAHFLPLYQESDGADSVASLQQCLEPYLPLSIALLGMGGDMHTASLFPGEAALSHDNRHDAHQSLRFVPVPGLAPKVPRMTLTVQAINAALSKHIVITGTDKKDAFDEAIRLKDPFQAPVAAVAPGATIHWAE